MGKVAEQQTRTVKSQVELDAALAQTVKRVNGSYVQAQCSCGWTGVLRTIRTVEGWSIAERDAKEHGYCHENGLGWFDYTKGWVQP